MLKERKKKYVIEDGEEEEEDEEGESTSPNVKSGFLKRCRGCIRRLDSRPIQLQLPTALPDRPKPEFSEGTRLSMAKCRDWWKKGTQICGLVGKVTENERILV